MLSTMLCIIFGHDLDIRRVPHRLGLVYLVVHAISNIQVLER